MERRELEGRARRVLTCVWKQQRLVELTSSSMRRMADCVTAIARWGYSERIVCGDRGECAADSDVVYFLMLEWHFDNGAV